MPYTYRTDEFDRLLKQREALWHQTLRSLSNSVIVRQSIGPAPEPQASLQAFDMGSLMTQADPMNQQIRSMEQQSLRQMRDQDDLIGAARFYGIDGADRIPVDELEEMISLRRENLRDYSQGLDIPAARVLYNGVATAIGQALTTPGQETLKVIGNIAERIPFIGEAISRSETMREADRWFNMVQEGLTADLPEGRRELSRGVAGAIGMFPSAILAWQGLGALGAIPRVATIGGRVSPLGRAMVRGTLSEMVIQDPTAPLQEQAMNAMFGAAFGGAEVLGGVVGSTIMGSGMGAIAGAIADDGDPRTMLLSALAGGASLGLGHMALNKVRRSFPSGAMDADYGDMAPRGGGPPTLDAEIIPDEVRGLIGPGGGGPGSGGWTPAGQLPPPGPLTGTVEDAMQGRVGRGQPWLTEESSLQDADYEIIEGLLGGPRQLGPGGSPQIGAGPTSIGPGQYEVYGVGSTPPGVIPDPTTPTGGPSVWMQTPPEVRGFIRRVVGERRASRRAAETDHMTGAGNRAAWSRAQVTAETDPTVSIVAFDVNNLKAANDLVGHEFGDQMITQASTALGQAAQEVGVANRVFRLGGDEFVAIVPNDRVAAYVDAAERLYGGHDAGQGYTVSIAGGVGNTLHEADNTLRAVKAGRNGSAYRNLNGHDAAQEAANLTKQGAILESPILADVAAVPKLDDADAAWAVVETFPGQVGVVQNVGDVASTVRRMLMDQMPNGVGPQDFRIVRRGDRSDILVSSGRSITNRMVKEYESFGMYAGQRAKIPTGQEVAITSIGPESSRVRPVHGGPEMEVNTSDLLPMQSSAIVDDIPGLYEGFETFGAIRLDMQARESGLAVVPRLLSEEGASQVPLLMDEFIRNQGVDPKSYYGATLRQILEERHIEALRNLAPIEEQAMLRSVQSDLQALQADMGPVAPASTEQLALVRGLDVRRSESGMDLVDDVSKGQIRVPVEGDEAAREFLHSFQRESIDDSPVTPFPLEVMETPPGYSETTGAMPGEYTSADQWGDASEEMIAHWYSQGGEEMLTRMMHPDMGGGAGGGIPPIGPPPSGTFGGWDPMRELPPADDVYARTAEQWRRARRNDPRRLKEITGQLDNIITRLFVPMRNTLERAQQYARSLGVQTADYLESMRGLDTQYNRHINDAHPWEERAYDILNPVRNRFWRDGTFWEVLNAPLDQQWHLMQNAGFNPAEREAVGQFKALMDDWIDNVARPIYPDMGYRENYVTWYRQFEEALPGDPFRRPREAEWGPEQARGKDDRSLEKNMGAIIPRYFRSFYKAQYMQEPYEHMRRMVASEEVPEVIREAVKQYADTRMWGLDPTKDWMVKGTHWLLNAAGKPFGQSFTTDDVMKLYMTGFNAEYRSGLGGRIDPLIRDLPQGFIGAAQVGLDRAVPVLKRMLRDDAYGEQARRLAHEAGWVQEGGGASIDPDVFGSAAPESSILRERMARGVDVIQDRVLRPLAMRHGIQGTWLDWLAPYGRLGDFARTWNGMVGYEAAKEALQKYTTAQASRQTWAVPLEDLQRQLLKDSRVSRYQGGVQQTFLDYVNRGDMEGAARFFGGEVAASQNLYGMAQQPSAWQKWGPVTGKKAMQWLTFNSQTLANMTHIARDKAISFPDKAAYLTQVGTLQALMAGAQMATGWNFMRMSLLGVGFGFAGSGIFDVVNRGQKLLAWWEQHNPAGQPLNPDQRALMGSPGSSYGSPFDPRYSRFNPWAGGMRTLEGMAESAQWGPEGAARFLTTGERGDPGQERMRRNMVEFDTMNPQQIDEILRDGQGPVRPEEPPQPGFGAMY